jgi:hypothetical protein
VFSILDSLRSLGHTLTADTDSVFGTIKLLLILAFQAGLLVNQLAQWHQHRQRRSRNADATCRRSPEPRPCALPSAARPDTVRTRKCFA